MVFLGIDGGTYKTSAMAIDEHGRRLGSGEAGPSNYQICGLDPAMEQIATAVRNALTAAGCSSVDVTQAVFGLSGMDLPMHRTVLEEGLRSTFPALPLTLVNDTWIMLKGGTDRGWGIALVCGGGANACACDAAGTRVTMRGLGYESGMRGGGLDMLRDVLHYAFLSHDGTGPRSLLEEAVLQVTGASGYDALQLQLLAALQDTPGNTELLHRALGVLPLVFRAASDGDEACRRILLAQGTALAEGALGLIRYLHLEREAFDIVLGGSLFLGENPLLIDQLTLLVHEMAPRAHLHRPLLDPVCGACLMAMEKSGLSPDSDLYRILARE